MCTRQLYAPDPPDNRRPHRQRRPHAPYYTTLLLGFHCSCSLLFTSCSACSSFGYYWQYSIGRGVPMHHTTPLSLAFTAAVAQTFSTYFSLPAVVMRASFSCDYSCDGITNSCQQQCLRHSSSLDQSGSSSSLHMQWLIQCIPQFQHIVLSTGLLYLYGFVSPCFK